MIFVALLGVLLSAIFPPDSMIAWGWRIPFLIGCLIVPLLFILRSSLQETDGVHSAAHAAAPSEPREILLQLAQNWRIVHHRHAAGDDDDGVVLFHHRLHADLRPRGAQAVGNIDSSRRDACASASPICSGCR